MSEVELEQVAGGTVGELADLTEAMLDKWPVLAKFGQGAAHVPGANRALANEVENVLRRDLGIEADISLGFCGTGADSDPNRYKEISTGRSLTHSEVLDRIHNAKKHF